MFHTQMKEFLNPSIMLILTDDISNSRFEKLIFTLIIKNNRSLGHKTNSCEIQENCINAMLHEKVHAITRLPTLVNRTSIMYVRSD